MESGIIGLPKTGKTTLFNALTHGKAQTAAYAAGGATNIGVAKVPDARLVKLYEVFHSQRMVPAEVKFVDVAAFPRGFGKGEGISGQLLGHLSAVDEMVHVVRAFDDPSIPHVENTIDPRRDIVTLNMELAFSDLAIQERRLERIVSSLKGAKSPEKEKLLREQALLDRVKAELEKDIPVRSQGLTPDEMKIISNYQFLTAKPLLVVVNIGEQDIPRANEVEKDLAPLCVGPSCDLLAACAKLEMELSGLGEEEAAEFRKSLEAGASALEQVIRRSFHLLGLITFFTYGEDEARAWTIPVGTTAVKAAGKIHSDLERGFIRAEVISYDDFTRCGSIAEARKKGLLRTEGKSYVVQDGDMMTILFNV